jgi:hypothetical protein
MVPHDPALAGSVDARPETFHRTGYPFSALGALADLVPDSGRMIIETGILADDNRRALLFCPLGEEGPYDASSVTFYNRKGMTDTLKHSAFAWTQPIILSRKITNAPTGRSFEPHFCATKDATLAAKYPHHYWKGGKHKNWR